uniref:Uncharacterized protein n=1 Tax=Hyaloperonospora arabidopsidis (strain Emoy2) TaxID=559515 RepID=M4B2H5_HYAAE
MAKGRGRAPAPSRNTDTISNTGEKLKQLHESVLTLLNFTKTMSSRVAHEVGDNNRQAGTISWYRYGNLNSQRSRKALKTGQQHAAQETKAWRLVSVLAMTTGVNWIIATRPTCSKCARIIFLFDRVMARSK